MMHSITETLLELTAYLIALVCWLVTQYQMIYRGRVTQIPSDSFKIMKGEKAFTLWRVLLRKVQNSSTV